MPIYTIAQILHSLYIICKQLTNLDSANNYSELMVNNVTDNKRKKMYTKEQHIVWNMVYIKRSDNICDELH